MFRSYLFILFFLVLLLKRQKKWHQQPWAGLHPSTISTTQQWNCSTTPSTTAMTWTPSFKYSAMLASMTSSLSDTMRYLSFPSHSQMIFGAHWSCRISWMRNWHSTCHGQWMQGDSMTPTSRPTYCCKPTSLNWPSPSLITSLIPSPSSIRPFVSCRYDNNAIITKMRRITHVVRLWWMWQQIVAGCTPHWRSWTFSKWSSKVVGPPLLLSSPCLSSPMKLLMLCTRRFVCYFNKKRYDKWSAHICLN